MEMLCFFSDGKLDRKGRLPPLALSGDRPVVKGDDLFGNSQSKTAASVMTRFISANETIHNILRIKIQRFL